MTLLDDAPQTLTPTRRNQRSPSREHAHLAERVERRTGASVVLGLSLAALVLASLAGFNRVFVDSAWVGPVVATALAAQALATVVRWIRLPPLAAMAVGLAGVATVGVVATLGAGAFASFPHGTWQVVLDALRQARTSLAVAVAPVPTDGGFDLLAAWGAGVVALLADWGAFRLRSPLHGAAPPLALFVMCCVLGIPAHRTADLAWWLASAVVYLLAHQVAMDGGGEAPFAGRRARSLPSTLATGAAIGAASLAVGLAITPALATRNGQGVLGWRDNTNTGGTRVVESPIVDLRTRIVKESDVPVFTVRSAVPSYWRLTSLDTFNGALWTSSGPYLSTGDQLPGVAAPPRGTRTVVEEFRIQDLDSIWLPAAFNPEAVTGAGNVTFDPRSSSLITGHATANNLVYRLTSFEQLASLSSAKLAGAPPPPDLRRDLQLPADIPPSVVSLARAITAGKTTEYAKALALQDYLLGPSFTYSTDPPDDGYSTSALATFLLDTRTGYCQQFAGAYAVMARIVGIPTRLAVGFAVGAQDSSGVYHVTDGDAHTWPEVYFPGYGWVPFEPTKGSFAIPEGDAYTGSTRGDVSAHPAPGGASKTATSTSVTKPAGGRSGVANLGATTDSSSRRGPHPDLGQSLMLAAAGVVAFGVLWPALNLAARRLRWARRRQRLGRAGRSGLLWAAWQEIGERLAWRGIRRRPDESPAEYARRASAELARMTAAGTEDHHGPEVDPALDRLAETVTRARYSSHEPSADATADALAAASALARALTDGAPVRLRLRWWLDPVPAWSDREAALS